jgi:hypothetical protein
MKMRALNPVLGNIIRWSGLLEVIKEQMAKGGISGYAKYLHPAHHPFSHSIEAGNIKHSFNIPDFFH